MLEGPAVFFFFWRLTILTYENLMKKIEAIIKKIQNQFKLEGVKDSPCSGNRQLREEPSIDALKSEGFWPAKKGHKRKAIARS